MRIKGLNITASDAISFVIFASVSLLFAFILLVFPYSYDDYWFLDEIYNEGPQVTGSDNLLDWLRYSIVDRYIHDNARIGNFIAEIMLILPRWIPMGLTAIIFIIGYRLTLRYACISMNSPLGVAAVSFMLTFAPLWHDSMFCQMYAFNYFWSLPLLFWALLTFLNNRPVNQGRAFVIGLLCAAWHECNAVSIIAGIIICILFHVRLIRGDRILLLIGATLALIWLTATPAWQYRDAINPKTHYFSKLIYLWAFYIFTIIWIVCLCIKRLRHICFDCRSLIMLTSGIGLSVLVWYCDRTRSAMPAMFLSAASVPWIIKKISNEYNFIPSRLTQIILTTIIVVITTTHLIVVCDRTVDLRYQYDCIVSEIKKDTTSTPKITVFAPIKYSWDSNHIALLRPQREAFMNNHLSVVFMSYYFKRKHVFIIPEELRQYRHGMGQPIEGHDSTRIYKGHLVSPVISDTLYVGSRINYGNRKEYAGVSHAIFTGADGRQYDYMLPDRSLISSFLGDPTYFRLDYEYQPPTK